MLTNNISSVDTRKTRICDLKNWNIELPAGKSIRAFLLELGIQESKISEYEELSLELQKVKPESSIRGKVFQIFEHLLENNPKASFSDFGFTPEMLVEMEKWMLANSYPESEIYDVFTAMQCRIWHCVETKVLSESALQFIESLPRDQWTSCQFQS